VFVVLYSTDIKQKFNRDCLEREEFNRDWLEREKPIENRRY